MRCKKSGFTIMELVVAIAIVAILSAIAVPNLVGWIPKRKLGAAARDVLSTVESARLTAVRNRVSVGIEFLADNVTYRVWLDDGTGVGNRDDAILNGTERTILTRTMPAGITVAGVTFGGPRSFRFDSQGFPIGTDDDPTAGSITLTNKKDNCVVGLTLAGNASIQ
ncbi:MAG: GspH/FimT family pseudopilin [Desulfobacterales bacterium]|nr:MAG: GspH/FimT family pseudopilin [Desulfobacterales bacterium]